MSVAITQYSHYVSRETIFDDCKQGSKRRADLHDEGDAFDVKSMSMSGLI